jgi:hypothetical protein
VNRAFVFSLARHLLTAVGSLLATKGYTSEADVETGIGAVLTLTGLVWAAFDKQRRPPGKPTPPTGPHGTQILPLLLALLCGLGITVTTPGCTTPGAPGEPRKFDPVPLVQSAAYVGSLLYLSDHPESRPVFERTLLALESLADRDTVGVLDLQQAFDPLLSASIKELRDGERRLIVTSSVALVQGYVGSMDLTKSENASRVRDVVRAARDGLRQALLNTAPAR